MRYLKKYWGTLLVAIVFALYTLCFFEIYKARSLDGELDNHILSAEMFGVPAELEAHGVKPLFSGKEQTGWDGQFYYYTANDILGRKDTANHVDSPSYRYQRIGLSVYVAAVSSLLGNTWVSPATYFWSYFLLIFVATIVGGRLLNRFGVHPMFVLLWSLSVGTQITLFNALPDAAADAFLIIALYLLLTKKLAWSIIPFSLSSLSREVYALFPSFIAFFYIVGEAVAARNGQGATVRNTLAGFFKRNFYLLLIPGLMAFVWRIYVTRHFGQSPSSQATGILGQPFAAWFEYFKASIQGQNALTGATISRYECITLATYLLLIIAALWTSARLLISRSTSASNFSGLALAFIALSLLYTCFGPVVMMHYSGYFKAMAVFFYLIPLLVASYSTSTAEKLTIYALLIFAFAVSTRYNLVARILRYEDHNQKFTQIEKISDKPRVECFGAYEAKIDVKAIRIFPRSPATIWSDDGAGKVVVELDLTNSGKFPFWSTREFGSVFMSYQWIDAQRRVVQDGIRSVIPGGLLPGQTKRVSIVSNLPTEKSAVLIASPVQEGCAWFYTVRPDAAPALRLQIE